MYLQEGKTSVAEDAKYKAIERIEADQLTDKHLPKILGAEKKGKVHLLRLQAGSEFFVKFPQKFLNIPQMKRQNWPKASC